MDRNYKPRNQLLLFFGISAFIALAAYVNLVPPDTMAAIAGFFAIFIGAVGLLSLYAFRLFRYAVAATIGVTAYLVLRYVGLTHPMYAVLLIAGVTASNYLLSERKNV